MSLKSINQDDLRNHNLSVVLDTMLRSVEPLSRAELAKATGLTKATMSLLIPMLIAGKAVREGSPASLPAQGRPSTPLSISGGRFCGIGLQINTDGFGFTAVDISGEIVAEEWISETMTQRDPEDIFGRLDELVRQGEAVIAERGMAIVGSGLALPGLVTEDLRLLTAHNLGWQQLDLRRFDVISRLDPHPDNEANMAALAQIPGYATQRRQQGIVGPADSFIYISTDIGIGGAVVHEGRVEHGDHGFAGSWAIFRWRSTVRCAGADAVDALNRMPVVVRLWSRRVCPTKVPQSRAGILRSCSIAGMPVRSKPFVRWIPLWRRCPRAWHR